MIFHGPWTHIVKFSANSHIRKVAVPQKHVHAVNSALYQPHKVIGPYFKITALATTNISVRRS